MLWMENGSWFILIGQNYVVKGEACTLLKNILVLYKELVHLFLAVPIMHNPFLLLENTLPRLYKAQARK